MMGGDQVNKCQERWIQTALDDMPRIVALKKKRAKERKRFVEKTFGKLVREIEREKKKAT
jgi:hypothetical protein